MHGNCSEDHIEEGLAACHTLIGNLETELNNEETGPDEDLTELLERAQKNLRWYATKKCDKGDEDACANAFSKAEQRAERGEDEEEDAQAANESDGSADQ